MKLRRGQSPTGTWAVLDFTGKPLPGRWDTHDDAFVHGYLGIYLLSGFEVVEVGVEMKVVS